MTESYNNFHRDNIHVNNYRTSRKGDILPGLLNRKQSQTYTLSGSYTHLQPCFLSHVELTRVFSRSRTSVCGGVISWGTFGIIPQSGRSFGREGLANSSAKPSTAPVRPILLARRAGGEFGSTIP